MKNDKSCNKSLDVHLNHLRLQHGLGGHEIERNGYHDGEYGEIDEGREYLLGYQFSVMAIAKTRILMPIPSRSVSGVLGDIVSKHRLKAEAI